MHFAVLLPSVLRKGYDHIPVRVHIAEQFIPIRYVPDFPVSGDLIQPLITRNVHPFLHVRTSKILQNGRLYEIPCINPVFFSPIFRSVRDSVQFSSISAAMSVRYFCCKSSGDSCSPKGWLGVKTTSCLS